MRCTDAAMLLERLAHGGAGRTVEIGPGEAALLDRLIAEGLVAPVDDLPAERAELERARERMRALAVARATSGTPGAEEKQLRARVLELSEKLAKTEGGVQVAVAGQGGPYRSSAATGASSSYRLTFRGRALLSDLAPRLARVGAMDVATVAAEMEALRDTFEARAKRAAEILRVISGSDLGDHGSELPLRGAAIGLALRNEAPAPVAGQFAHTFRVLRAPSHRALTREQLTSAAECLVLGAPQLPDVRPGELLQLREHYLGEHCRDRPEDALDAALMMIDADPALREQALHRCIEVATEVQRQASTPLMLSLALLVVRSGADHEATTVARLAAAWRLLMPKVAQPIDGIAVATLLALGTGGVEELVERWSLLRDYLGRFGSEAMAVPAALLALVDADVPETLDHLRLAATAIQQHRLAAGGAETTAHAVKLLLGVAVLASGSEGDPEERLRLAPLAHPRLPALGMASLAATLPVALQTVAIFHRPMLDAAEIDAVYHPVHSSYFYSSGSSSFGGRSGGWG